MLNNTEINPQKYGLGWRIHTLNLGEGIIPTEYMHHGGVSAGAQSFLMVVPRYKLSIAVNANVRTKVFWDFAKVAHELARIFVTEVEQT
ncbi:serine hydrolase [Pseudoalteromonas sp. T1lg23B]|uniref:serine hydrolase n=1 Tax=Pseudoalteromonas sp. T1lg23B TaxID=2077097 RepID=UPI000CF6FB2B|nr:serine hydrolase [Pseudoalteromonas sp. T1lg23B]